MLHETSPETAAQAAYCLLLGYGPRAADESIRSADQVRKLADELRRYSNAFQIVEDRNHLCDASADEAGFVLIYGDDDGCVNEGSQLATCWLEGDAFSTDPLYFYWES